MKRHLKQLIREDNFLSLAGNLLIAVFGLAGFALLARQFTPAQFGQWALFVSGGSLIEMFRFGISSQGLVHHTYEAYRVDADPAAQFYRHRFPEDVEGKHQR